MSFIYTYVDYAFYLFIYNLLPFVRTHLIVVVSHEKKKLTEKRGFRPLLSATRHSRIAFANSTIIGRLSLDSEIFETKRGWVCSGSYETHSS